MRLRNRLETKWLVTMKHPTLALHLPGLGGYRTIMSFGDLAFALGLGTGRIAGVPSVGILIEWRGNPTSSPPPQVMLD